MLNELQLMTLFYVGLQKYAKYISVCDKGYSAIFIFFQRTDV
jgi:hypothetical protein